MTTTGGYQDPPVDFADLGAGGIDRLDGDDIVVEPDGAPETHARRRARELVVAVVVIGVAVTAIVFALATRHHTRAASSLAPPAVVRPAPVGRVVATTPLIQPGPAAGSTPGAAPTTAPVTTPTSASDTVVGPPPVTAPTAPPQTPPVAAEPPSVLVWHASPSALTITAGSHATLTVTVANPTDGIVTLGSPLSCPPSLQDEHGTSIGGSVCVEMAQLVSPHQTLTQTYTIYATDTGDAGGSPLSTGRYTAEVEHLFSVPVTIGTAR